jgi:hypothetical protein
LLFDGDLSPEGLTETLTLWDDPKSVLRRFRIQGIQWTLKELSNDADAWMFGAQVQAQFSLPRGVVMTVSLADYGFQRLNVIARERNSNATC